MLRISGQNETEEKFHECDKSNIIHKVRDSMKHGDIVIFDRNALSEFLAEAERSSSTKSWAEQVEELDSTPLPEDETANSTKTSDPRNNQQLGPKQPSEGEHRSP